MCGIAGILNMKDASPVERSSLERMIAMLHHRGPDGTGYYLRPDIGLAHSRLSIIDIDGGAQPITNEDGSLWVVFNGEIFNYLELRTDLEKLGHRFSTNSDTEVIVHLFEEKGARCLDDLNGQFAIALWDGRRRKLLLARDRMGIRPLFYTIHDGRFYFGSEIKAIFAAESSIPREIDPVVLKEVFTFWMPGDRETIFKGIRQLAPGHYAWVDTDGISESEYWDIPFTLLDKNIFRSEVDYAEEYRELLIDSIRLQLRADVPVGAYLSGGLDSSSITSLVRSHTSNRLKTFSVTFSDSTYDESSEQQEVVSFLDTDHASVNCISDEIASVFPDVVWHAETPLLRTAPAPLLLLSRLVRENGYKVVLTGEGADEILGGYDIFKEAKIRAFIHRDTSSSLRPLLLKRLYPYLALSPTESAAYATKFFDTGASPLDPFYSHRPRWKTTCWTHNFLRNEIADGSFSNPIDKIESRYGHKLSGLDFFSAAQYLEAKTLLGNYLLSSQGDRMAMANSVEGRFPFLDHRLVEYACQIPPGLRMKTLNEKNILKKAMAGRLPSGIICRKKQPYMAPDIASFSGKIGREHIECYLSKDAIINAGIFKPQAVRHLVEKCLRNQRQGFRENMAFVGILSTQILIEKFVNSFTYQ
ncbi:asparagine synthetase [glutamine-hydrolyzing] 1 [Geobacter sp. OR-1]|uniref:asparagine synthase (glutamine-hydrolyzing) n=1 Tax=Geobacter sp. OR-1 TaxID=1266765 RepID=UPI0005435037|nr:asparagine synthase (glutamine-hydrolyzing) [Geobacter sp. OR-1]GAM10593.1 asparagine synthetase [glutamine-hydrolyzing] 1 [Geobacter sp. OR-1]